MKLNYVSFGSLMALLIVGIVVAVLIKNPSNKAQTSPNHKDKKLRTRKYRIEGNFAQFSKKVENMIPQIQTYGRNWKLTSSNIDSGGNSVILKVEVPVFFYIDDLEIEIRQIDHTKEITVDAASRSRKGKSDLGENRRHIIQFFTELEKAYDIEPGN